MKTNLSSQITLNRVSPRYYRPENAFERSVLTRLEKIPTDIYESAEEGANQIALDIAQLIRDKQKAGRFCVLALAGGNSPRNVYADLVRMHHEYYPLAPNAINSNFNALKEMLIDHVDIDKQNVFTPDSTIAKDAIFEYCRLYEQRIESFGGLDIALLGIGRVGNIGFNEPGESFDKQVHCVNLTESTIEANKRFFASAEDVPKQAYTMGIKTIMQAKKILIVASGEDKAEIVQKAFFGPITPQVPASVLQLHNDVTLVADEAALSKLSE